MWDFQTWKVSPPILLLSKEKCVAPKPTLLKPTAVSGQRQNSLTFLFLGLFWVASFLTQLKFFVPMEFLGFVPHSFTTNTAMGTNILDMCIIKSKIPLLETRSLRIKRVSSFPRFVRIMYPLPSCFHKRKMCNSVEIPGNIPRSKSSCQGKPRPPFYAYWFSGFPSPKSNVKGKSRSLANFQRGNQI